jgi:hypothetical protein
MVMPLAFVVVDTVNGYEALKVRLVGALAVDHRGIHPHRQPPSRDALSRLTRSP